MGTQTTGLRLSAETRSRLEELGRLRDRSPHYLMNAAVERYLDAEEALEAERRIVRERWEKFELTGEALDHSDVRAWAATLSPRTAKKADGAE